METFRSPNEVLLGVMDGHGTHGHVVSAFLAQHLPAVLMQKLVCAAAALQGSSSSSSTVELSTPKQRKLFGKASKQHKRQQELEQRLQTGHEQYSLGGEVPFVVVPASTASNTCAGDVFSTLSSSSSARAASRGKAVQKQHIVQRPSCQPLNTDDGSSSSSMLTSSQPWLNPVPHERVQQVVVTKELLNRTFVEADATLSGAVNVTDRCALCCYRLFLLLPVGCA